MEKIPQPTPLLKHEKSSDVWWKYTISVDIWNRVYRSCYASTFITISKNLPGQPSIGSISIPGHGDKLLPPWLTAVIIL
jgi:hypothetical protein